VAKKVLVTGVSGLIGGVVFDHLAADPAAWEPFGSSRRRASSARVTCAASSIGDDRFYAADCTDADAMARAMEGKDLVVHMAAVPDVDAPWSDILASNLDGTYQVFEAARAAGVERIVYASSIMVNWGCRQDEPYKSIVADTYTGSSAEIPIVDHLAPVRPDCLYAASKVAGEALARTFVAAHGMSILCLRIGWVKADDNPGTLGAGSFWCSKRDIARLVEASLRAPDALRFDIFYGVSHCAWRWPDIAHAKELLGYEPLDRAEDAIAASWKSCQGRHDKP
jgi:nucleoside-diphosphate-sugar epimerase